MTVFFEKVQITWILEIRVHWTRRKQDPIILNFLKMYETLGNEQICLETSIKVISDQQKAHFTCFWQLSIPQKNTFWSFPKVSYIFRNFKTVGSCFLLVQCTWISKIQVICTFSKNPSFFKNSPHFSNPYNGARVYCKCSW